MIRLGEENLTLLIIGEAGDTKVNLICLNRGDNGVEAHLLPLMIIVVAILVHPCEEPLTHLIVETGDGTVRVEIIIRRVVRGDADEDHRRIFRSFCGCFCRFACGCGCAACGEAKSR